MSELTAFAIQRTETWTAKCPRCGVTMFRASEEAIERAALEHPCPPPVARSVEDS